MIRALLAGDEVSYRDRRDNLPLPVQRPTPPLLIGGNSRASALRRSETVRRYSPAVDAKDWDAVGSMCTDDAHFVIVDIGEGHSRDRVVSFLRMPTGGGSSAAQRRCCGRRVIPLWSADP